MMISPLRNKIRNQDILGFGLRALIVYILIKLAIGEVFGEKFTKMIEKINENERLNE